jgi:hypothetical protein
LYVSINLNVLYLSVRPTSSSVYSTGAVNYGPIFAIDGLVSAGYTDGYTKQFISVLTVQPWFQMEFSEARVVNGITFTNRKDCCGERFQNVGIHVGDQPAVVGALVTNPECVIFVGPSATGSVDQITCTQPLTGRYLQVQLKDPNPQHLQINEIVTW